MSFMIFLAPKPPIYIDLIATHALLLRILNGMTIIVMILGAAALSIQSIEGVRTTERYIPDLIVYIYAASGQPGPCIRIFTN